MWRIAEKLSDLLIRPRRALREFDLRRELDDQEFVRTFYASSDIDPQVPLRIRRLLAKQLGQRWMRVLPTDCIPEIDDELDFVELVKELEGEFQITIPEREWKLLDGSFESLVQCVARKR